VHGRTRCAWTKPERNPVTGNAPQEPTAEIRTAASFMRQWFVALANEGFSENQALVIIGQMLAAGARGQTDK
jgi:hypothetical protein